MAGTWIIMHTNLHESQRVMEIEAETGLDPFSIVGRLHRVWSWADDHTVDGATTITTKMLDRIASHDGFAAAMVNVGWLSIDDGGKVFFTRFGDHNGRTAKQRAKNAKRNAQMRHKRDGPVTVPCEKRDGDDIQKHHDTVTYKTDTDTDTKQCKTKSAASATAGFEWAADCPVSLNTPEVVTAFREWESYRREAKLGKWKPITIRKCLAKFEQLGPNVFIAAIDRSIANGWHGIFPPGARGGKPPGRTNDRNTIGDEDILAKLERATA